MSSPKIGLKTKKHTKHNILPAFLISNTHSQRSSWSWGYQRRNKSWCSQYVFPSRRNEDRW